MALTKQSEPTRIIAIDGRSGAGKSTLAAGIARELGAQLIHMDALYPGWRGLDAGAALVVDHVLEPLRRGEVATWPSWDWHRSEPGPMLTADPGGVVVLEGCGSLTRASAPLFDVRVWLELDEDERRERAEARDGTSDEWWELWRGQEEALIAREDPRSLAEFVLDAHAGERELVERVVQEFARGQ